jgi:RecB family exonuclease
VFRTANGRPAQLVVLRTAHRQPAALREVSARVASRIGSAGAVAHRSAAPGADPGPPADDGPGRIGVHLLASPAQEAAFVAQLLRRRHLDQGTPWSRMAVVVRSSRSTQALRRTLGATGIPVAVPSTEVPVRDEAAVVPLRLALRCVLDPSALTPEVAVELLTGPIGGADALSLRRLRQAVRAVELADGGGRASDALLVQLLAHPGNVNQLDGRVALAPRRVAGVLAAGREALAAGPVVSAETVVWALWQATRLADTWRRVALSGGVAGARADRDLDAVVALFEAAARFVDRLPRAGPGEFLAYLEGQELPSDTLADRAPSGEAVALVTASGAAGREWDVVAVTGVQEGVWPDLRLRSSLLGAQVLADLVDGRGAPGPGGGGHSAQRRAVLDDELRQFHVAVSRARRELVVTAVRSEDLLPSPFLDLVDPGEPSGPAEPGVVPPGTDDELRPLSEVPRTMTLPALVAELRATVADDRLDRLDDGPDRRRLAAAHLARLAASGVPGADPDDWYGLAPLSTADPLRGADQAVAVSPSRVEAFERCALRWLLEQAGGRPASTVNVSLGNLVHELAEAVPDGDVTLLRDLLARRFPRLGLGPGWVADAERERAERMIGKLAEYVRRCAADRRTLVATEQPVTVEVGRAVVSGLVDRLEQDGDGRLVVVDLKTGRSAPRTGDLARHAQLGVYQLAVEQGGFDEVAPDHAGSGGAMLVQLGGRTKGVGIQEQPALAEDDDPLWARRLVETVADGMAAARFAATVNPMCRMCSVRRSCPIQLEGRQVGQ